MAIALDVMETDILAVRPTDPVAAVARQMAARGVGAALVVEGDVLAAIFTERDLLIRVVAIDPQRMSGAPLREEMRPLQVARSGLARGAHPAAHLGEVEGVASRLRLAHPEQLCGPLDAVGRRGEERHVEAVQAMLHRVAQVALRDRPELFRERSHPVPVAEGIGVEPVRYREVLRRLNCGLEHEEAHAQPGDLCAFLRNQKGQLMKNRGGVRLGPKAHPETGRLEWSEKYLVFGQQRIGGEAGQVVRALYFGLGSLRAQVAQCNPADAPDTRLHAGLSLKADLDPPRQRPGIGYADLKRSPVFACRKHIQGLPAVRLGTGIDAAQAALQPGVDRLCHCICP
mgnify:CR=1 FL=1